MQMSQCTNCGNALAENARFCVHCGVDVSSYQAQTEKKGKLGRVIKWTGIGCGGLVGLLIIIIIIGAIAGGGESDKNNSGSERASVPTSPTPKPTSIPTQISTIAPTPTPKLSEIPFEQLKGLAGQVSYDDLFRNNESFVGKLVYYRGRVIQVLEEGKDKYQLRANVTQGDYSWDDTVYLRYSGSRLLDEDIIEFVGEVNGLIKYKAIFGNEITIPEITIIQSQLVAKASDPTPIPLPRLTPTPVPTVPGTPTPTVAPTPTPEPINLSGIGQQATPTFVLREGLTIFKMTHDGRSNFIVRLLDGRGDRISSLTNEIGLFDGSKAIRLEESEAYILDISADGSWSVNVTQPAPLAEFRYPLTLAGNGQQASEFFHLEAGLTTFKMTHDGRSNFIVRLLDGRGDRISSLTNEIGIFDGSKAVGISELGVYILDISADGNWTINIEQ